MKLTTIFLILILVECIRTHYKINKGSSAKEKEFATPSNVTKSKEEKISIHQVKNKKKIKDKPINDKQSKEDKLVEDTIFAITEDRLKDIDKQEEERIILDKKINFKKSLESENDELCENMDIDYDAILDTQCKLEIAENIVEEQEHLWFNDPRIQQESKIQIPIKKFKVLEYSF